jgi:MoxR-like ATPase
MIDQRRAVRVVEPVREYIVKVSRATRQHPEIELGASPRATLALYQTAQAWAAINGRDYVLPDDVKFLAPHVLTHRLMISPQAQLRGRRISELVSDIVEAVPVPVEN